MKNYIWMIAGGMLLLQGCGGTVQEEETESAANVPVTVTHIGKADLTSYMDLTATSVFLNKSVVKSPVQAYIDELKVLPGDPVTKNEVLVVLKTKEAQALQGDSLNPLGFKGKISMRAAIDGVITTVDHARGDYVSEGDPLATVVIPSSLVFVLNVPFESAGSVRVASECNLVLPDARTIPGTVKMKLANVDQASQTQKFYVVPRTKDALPENLVAKVRIPLQRIKDAVVLDKSCILSDELMQQFWVMKMINDTLAVKVPVKTGLAEDNKVQVLSPVFSDSDRILNSGNYGLGDTVRVTVKNETK